MKRRAFGVLALMALVAATTVSCAQSAAGRWQQAAITFTGAEKGIDLAHTSGMISDDQLIETQPYLAMGKGALDESFDLMVADLAAGRTPTGGEAFDQFLDIVQSAVAELTPFFVTTGGEQ